jgi:hypothetical protein
MNLGAPRARMLIGPEGPCRWRSNGHLRRCRCASAPHVPTAYAPVWCTGRAVRARRILPRADRVDPVCLASDTFLNRLRRSMTRTGS